MIWVKRKNHSKVEQLELEYKVCCSWPIQRQWSNDSSTYTGGPQLHNRISIATKETNLASNNTAASHKVEAHGKGKTYSSLPPQKAKRLFSKTPSRKSKANKMDIAHKLYKKKQIQTQQQSSRSNRKNNYKHSSRSNRQTLSIRID